MKVANTAYLLGQVFTTIPNKNSPRIPPLKIEAKAHQASKALLTPLKAKPTRIAKSPMAKEESRSTLSSLLLERLGRKYFLT
jgi:hypothetical protein